MKERDLLRRVLAEGTYFGGGPFDVKCLRCGRIKEDGHGDGCLTGDIEEVLMDERKEVTERIEEDKKRLPGALGDPVVVDEELRSVFLGGHEERLAALLADAKPATAEELKAQGESLARNYKPGPRQARPFLPSNEEERATLGEEGRGSTVRRPCIVNCLMQALNGSSARALFTSLLSACLAAAWLIYRSEKRSEERKCEED